MEIESKTFIFLCQHLSLLAIIQESWASMFWYEKKSFARRVGLVLWDLKKALRLLFYFLNLSFKNQHIAIKLHDWFKIHGGGRKSSGEYSLVFKWVMPLLLEGKLSLDVSEFASQFSPGIPSSLLLPQIARLNTNFRKIC